MSALNSPGYLPYLMDYLENIQPPPPVPERSALRAKSSKTSRSTRNGVSSLSHSAGPERSISYASSMSSWSSGYPSQQLTTKTSRSSVSNGEKRQSQLAPWIPTQVESQVVECALQHGTLRGPSNLADLLIVEISAEIENLQTGVYGTHDVQWGDSVAENLEWRQSALTQARPTQQMVLTAKARIQNFESTWDYRAYARDLDHCDQHSSQYSKSSLERAKKRVEAFESSDGWYQYLNDLQTVLEGDEDGFEMADQKLRSGVTWETEDVKGIERRRDGEESLKIDAKVEEEKKKKRRVSGKDLSTQWKALGVKERPGGGMFGSGGFGV